MEKSECHSRCQAEQEDLQEEAEARGETVHLDGKDDPETLENPLRGDFPSVSDSFSSSEEYYLLSHPFLPASLLAQPATRHSSYHRQSQKLRRPRPQRGSSGILGSRTVVDGKSTVSM